MTDATNPWYLDVLGLDQAGADEKTVRRAYASKLKVTDPVSDPQGFERLREAYEAARASMRGSTTPAEAMAMPPMPVAQEPGHDDIAALIRAAADRIERFVSSSPADAFERLQADVAELGVRSADAPARFEEELIDRLAMSRVAAGRYVLMAAIDVFDWHDVGRLRRLGARGHWIERVLIDLDTFAALPARVREEWQPLLDAGLDDLDDRLVRLWPVFEYVSTTFRYLGAICTTTVRGQAWRTAFLDLPASERGAFTYIPPLASEPTRRPSVRRSYAIPVCLFLLVTIVAGWGYFVWKYEHRHAGSRAATNVKATGVAPRADRALPPP